MQHEALAEDAHVQRVEPLGKQGRAWIGLDHDPPAGPPLEADPTSLVLRQVASAVLSRHGPGATGLVRGELAAPALRLGDRIGQQLVERRPAGVQPLLPRRVQTVEEEREGEADVVGPLAYVRRRVAVPWDRRRGPVAGRPRLDVTCEPLAQLGVALVRHGLPGESPVAQPAQLEGPPDPADRARGVGGEQRPPERDGLQPAQMEEARARHRVGEEIHLVGGPLRVPLVLVDVKRLVNEQPGGGVRIGDP